MTRTIRAAVFRDAAVAPVIEELELADPEPGEVVVRVAASGICHTDRAIAAGDLWPVFPVVLGHEIAGTIEECGEGVVGVAPGDRVVVIDGHCGQCADCLSGHPVQCRAFDFSERARHLVDADGLAVYQSVGGFSDFLVVPAHSVIPVPADIPYDVAAVASCAGVTGVGAVLNVAQVQAGDAVAVLGCGGVGLSAVMAAAAAGAGRILAIDPDPARRELALRVGATDAREPHLTEIRAVYSQGFAAVIECVGHPEAMTLATRLVARGGCAVITGAPKPDAVMDVDVLDLVLDQRRVLGCLRGDVRPGIDLPRIFELYRRGLMPLNLLVGERIELEAIVDAFVDPAASGLRTVVTRP